MTYPSYMQKAPRGYQHSPCPGCGVECVHKKDKVCEKCADILSRWAVHQREQAVKAEEKPYITKERSYGFPYLSHEKQIDGHKDSIREPLLDLHHMLSRPAEDNAPYNLSKERGADAYTYPLPDKGWRDEWSTVRIFPVAAADALRKLFIGIRDSLVEAHATGFKEGKSLIANLASGRISIDQFNETAARIERKRDEQPD